MAIAGAGAGRELREPVQALADHLCIRELTARYNRAFDDGDGDAFAATFTPDGVFEAGGHVLATGRAELAAYPRARPRGTIHATTDAIIDVDGDEAVQRCTLLVARLTGEGTAVSLHLSGRYVDRLVRTDEGWRFSRRTTAFHMAPESPGR